jgi:hypothetical protein
MSLPPRGLLPLPIAMMTIPCHVLHTVVLVFSVIDMILFPVPNLPVIPPPLPLSLCGQPWPTPAWVWLQSICFFFLPLYEPSRLAATADALTDSGFRSTCFAFFLMLYDFPFLCLPRSRRCSLLVPDASDLEVMMTSTFLVCMSLTPRPCSLPPLAPPACSRTAATTHSTFSTQSYYCFQWQR